MYVRQYTSEARAREKPCVQCGLSLRKHLDDRYCPQCGLSIWMTLNGNDALDYSKPKWLTRAARGAWIMAAVQLLAMLAYLLGMAASASELFVAATYAHAHAAATQEADEDEIELVQQTSVTPLLVAAVAATGVYFLAEGVGLVALTPHEQRFPDRMKRIRIAARAAAGGAALLGVGLLAIAGMLAVRRGTLNGIQSWLLLLLIEIAFAGCAFVSWFWVRSVVRRAGRSALARLCGYLLFLPVIPFVKAAPFLGLWMFYLVSPLLHFLPLAYVPLSIYLYARSAWLLGRAVPHAREAWAKESSPPVAVAGGAVAGA